MQDRNKLISDAYYSNTGFKSAYKIFKDVIVKEPAITFKMVKDWFESNLEKKRQVRGVKNSFVAQSAHQEYEIDVFFITDRQFKNQAYKFGLSMIDVFSKYATVIPMKDRKFKDIATAILKGFQNMGKQPDVIYSDDEGALTNKEATSFFEDMGIQLITTTGSAHFVERFNRTFKNMMHARYTYAKSKVGVDSDVLQWSDFIPIVLSVYNNKDIHTATGKTPTEARKPSAELDVKNALELKATRGRKYPELSIGDSVRILKKKNTVGDKEFMTNFKYGTHKVVEISTNLGQTFYKLTNGREFIRSDIVKI